VVATYAAVLAVLLASVAIGLAALALCGVRRWSWLAPAVGLGLLCAVCWATVRIGDNGVAPAVLVPLLAIAAAVYLRGRIEGGEALRVGLPVGMGALLAASLPFAVEGHFGILGTGFNPDMSQHLLATDRLAEGHTSQLLKQGYPLSPHSVVVALNEGLGIGLVQGFSGLTMAAAIVAALTALAPFSSQALPRGSGVPFQPLWWERHTGSIAAALVVGLAYLVASYYAQGAFKEVIQGLLVLAFVLALRESTRVWRDLPLRFVPAALIAIGSVYVYSFPGLLWLGAIAALWLIWEYASPAGGTVGRTTPEEALATGGGGGSPAVTGPAGLRALSLAILVFAAGALPELGRMIDFHSFETFDPNGPGLGNLFGQISPLTALGIWPSGDFRLAPGDGAVPAFVYYLGAAFAIALLILGARRAWRGRERAILAGLISVAALYAAARIGGTPYTAAKALEITAPLAALAILLPLIGGRSPAGGVGEGVSRRPRRPLPRSAGSKRDAPPPGGEPSNRGDTPSPTTGPAAAALVLYLIAAGSCSLLAFANAPVGPTSYSPALTTLRPLLATGSTLVLAPDKLLEEEQGVRYIAWELRGGRVCIEPESAAGGRPPTGVRFFVTEGSPSHAPFSQLKRLRLAGPYVVWERRGVLGGPSPCPLIAVRQARSGDD
jgi:hypothetical protein